MYFVIFGRGQLSSGKFSRGQVLRVKNICVQL